MSRSHNDRTSAEIREQKCIEANPQLFAKQIRGEAFTVEESEQIATCALPTAEEIQANHTAGWIMVGIFVPIFLAIVIMGGYQIWKAEKECKEAEREWQEGHKKRMEELDRIIAEGKKRDKK